MAVGRGRSFGLLSQPVNSSGVAARALWRFRILIVICILDATSSTALYLSLHSMSSAFGGDVGPLLVDLSALLDIRDDTLGILLMSALRVSTVLTLSTFAARIGSNNNKNKQRASCHHHHHHHHHASGEEAESDVMTTPLISQGDDNDDNDDNHALGGDAEKLSAVKARERKRDVVVACLFALCCLTCLFQAVQCSTFRKFEDKPLPLNWSSKTWSILRVLLMASGIFWGNLEAVFAVQWVEIVTRRRGYLKPSVHMHELIHSEVPNHRCDVCRGRVRTAMRCEACDFDICLKCFRKGDRSRGEGGIRGDRGVRNETDAREKGPFSHLMRVWSVVKSERLMVAAALSSLLVTTAAEIASPSFTGSILDHVVKNDRKGFELAVLYLTISAVVQSVLGAFKATCFRIVGRKITWHIRQNLFSQLLRQDIAFFDAAATGDLVSRLGNDVTVMTSPITTTLGSFIGSLARLIGGLACSFIVSWRLALLAFTTLVPAAYLTKRFAMWSSSLNAHIFTSLGEATKTVNDALGNIRTVKSSACEDLEHKKYKRSLDRALKEGILDAKGAGINRFLGGLLDEGSLVIVLWFGGNLALQHMHGGDAKGPGLTVGRLIAFQLYWSMFNNSFENMQNLLATFTRSAGAATRVWSLVDSFPDINDQAGAGSVQQWLPASASVGPKVELRDVVFAYQMREEVRVLQGLDVSIAPSEVGALVGPSGGGKSTVIHLLLRFYDPHEGQVMLDSRDLRSLRLQDVRRKTGLVSQETQLFAESILYNLAYGLHDCDDIDAVVLGASTNSAGDEETSTITIDDAGEAPTREQVLEACEMAQARVFIESFPDGLATRVGERGVRLSGGQRQRIAVARAFLRKPRLLLLDEATSALDSESEALVQQALNHLMEQRTSTVAVVAHRLSTVRNANAIHVVSGGQCAERGRHEELMAIEDGIYKKLVKTQVEAGATSAIGEDQS